MIYTIAVVSTLVGVVYFSRSDAAAGLGRRFIASLYGPAIALLLVVVAFWPDQYRYTPRGVAIFYWLQVVPLILLSYSLARYPGRAMLHLILVPIGLLCWLLIFIIGFFEIHGE